MSKDEIYCSTHCICLQISLPEKKIEELKDKAKRIGNEISKQIEEENKVILKHTKFRFGFSDIKNGRCLFSVRLDFQKGTGEELFFKAFPYIQKVLDTLEEFSVKELKGTFCTSFIFDLEKFSPVGGIILPTVLNLDSKLVNKLGEANLIGFDLKFSKSPIGLDTLEISVNDKDLIIEPSIDSTFTTIKDLVQETFTHSKEVALFFVERRK